MHALISEFEGDHSICSCCSALAPFNLFISCAMFNVFFVKDCCVILRQKCNSAS